MTLNWAESFFSEQTRKNNGDGYGNAVAEVNGEAWNENQQTNSPIFNAGLYNEKEMEKGECKLDIIANSATIIATTFANDLNLIIKYC